LDPGDDAGTVTAAQLREVVIRLINAGQWQPGDPHFWIVADAGYDGPRLAFLLADLPVRVLVRMRSDRVLRRPAPPRLPGTNGRPPRHGGEFVFGDPASWGAGHEGPRRYDDLTADRGKGHVVIPADQPLLEGGAGER
jgi:DDE superfamily endonuclease